MFEQKPTDRTRAQLSRRAALTMGAGAMMVFSQLHVAGAATSSDVAEEARIMYRKLHYRTDSGPLFWWIQGPYFAEIEATLTPLFAINMGVIQQVTQRDDGGLDLKQLELSFRTDIESGKRLSAFHNPITNETVPVDFSPIGPSLLHFSKDNLAINPPNLVGSTATSIHYPPRRLIKGDDVFFTERSSTRVSTPGTQDRIFNDFSTISGSLKQLRDPRVTSADVKLQSSDISSWQRWMNMGDRPGWMTLRALGAKVEKFGDLPADWLAMAYEIAPDIAADPMGSLERPAAAFKN